MKLIALAGQAGAAKDTIANYLVEKFPNWHRVGFADAVKRVFMNSFGVDLEFIENWKRKDEIPPGFNLNVRKSLQFIGDGFRQIQSDIWIKTALRVKGNIIISDCRYVNEAKMVHESNGVTVLIWRKGWENDDPNPSEAQVKPFVDFCAANFPEGPIEPVDSFPDLKYYDFFLKNEGSLMDLYKKIDGLLVPYLHYRGLEL